VIGGVLKVLVCVSAYLVGAIPFGYLAAKLAGVDITEKGSGNIGATNVLRTLGLSYAIPVLLLDVAKGALAAYAGLRCLDLGTVGALIAGALAISGHNWSVFLGFRGGKGVATSAGVGLVMFPLLLMVAVLVFVLVVAATRYVSLGSLLGVWSAFAFSLIPGQDTTTRGVVLIIAILITYRHRSNIGRLISGTENKVFAGKGRTSE
jgi:glycerol-3-phosphate acyltransferase PlsY